MRNSFTVTVVTIWQTSEGVSLPHLPGQLHHPYKTQEVESLDRALQWLIRASDAYLTTAQAPAPRDQRLNVKPYYPDDHRTLREGKRTRHTSHHDREQAQEQATKRLANEKHQNTRDGDPNAKCGNQNTRDGDRTRIFSPPAGIPESRVTFQAQDCKSEPAHPRSMF